MCERTNDASDFENQLKCERIEMQLIIKRKKKRLHNNELNRLFYKWILCRNRHIHENNTA